MAKYSGVLEREDSETNSLLSSKVKTTITMNGNHIKKVNRLFNKYAATSPPAKQYGHLLFLFGANPTN